MTAYIICTIALGSACIFLLAWALAERSSRKDWVVISNEWKKKYMAGVPRPAEPRVPAPFVDAVKNACGSTKTGATPLPVIEKIQEANGRYHSALDDIIAIARNRTPLTERYASQPWAANYARRSQRQPIHAVHWTDPSDGSQHSEPHDSKTLALIFKFKLIGDGMTSITYQES